MYFYWIFITGIKDSDLKGGKTKEEGEGGIENAVGESNETSNKNHP